MNAELLRYFPAHTHPLTLVSDPDRLLAGEALMAELARRGFQVIQEEDPVLLRHRVEQAQPFTVVQPVLLTTTGAIEDLPYDLYQGAYRINLSLHPFFPNLAYPVLQTLSPDQIEKLAACPPPPHPLSRQKTIEYLLREVFQADIEALRQPHACIRWLNDYHHQQSPLPDLLRASLTERLKRFSTYQAWDLDLLIRDARAFQSFIQQEWQSSLAYSLSERSLHETRPPYALPFHTSASLQDLVPGLVRRGTLQPVMVENQSSLPLWAQPGVTWVDGRLQRMAALLEEMRSHINALQMNTPVGWSAWKELALAWAELSSLRFHADLAVPSAVQQGYSKVARDLEGLFTLWLKKHYPALGAQRLPTPHHVHHIPHYLAHLRNLGKVEKVVLLVLDGLSLMDWQTVSAAWAQRHEDWKIKTEVVLSQIPTITSISRYALLSGLRPADFAHNMEPRVSEARAWELFWSREGVAESACKLLPLYYDRQIDQSPELQDPRVNFWCLIDDTPDRLAHHATLGAADQQSSLRLWLDPMQHPNSLPLEAQVGDYLDQGFSVFIASDHGHVEAVGVGQPSEGLVAQTRGKRARMYQDRRAARNVQNAFTDTILWDQDGLLPDESIALMPAGQEAFAPVGDVVVTHGGISIDEVIVPFIQIIKEGQ